MRPKPRSDGGRLRKARASKARDPACELIVAWSLLTAQARDVFPAALEVDDATWARGRGTALSVAIVTLPYYLNTNPAIVASARNTIDEVLADHGLGACHNSASGIEIQFDSLEGAEGPPRALARSTAAGSAPVQPSNPRGLTNSASSRLD